MLEIILISLIAIVVILLVIASKKPDEFRYTRAILINAQATEVFPHINNLHKFNEWNPWAKLDPNSKSNFTGTDQGIGAIMSWEGSGSVGAGIMTCTQSRPFDFVQFRMNFLKPMKAVNIAEFILVEAGSQTTVTWAMYGPNTLMGKVVSLFINCEKMVGEQFEKGLVDLKNIVER